jgi:ATP-dependent RNA helicase DeaD
MGRGGGPESGRPADRDARRPAGLRDRPAPRPDDRDRRDRPRDHDRGAMTSLSINAGREAGIFPADIVGAIANEAKVPSRDLGKITIRTHHAVVEVPEAVADRVIRALQRTTLRGRKVEVRR